MVRKKMHEFRKKNNGFTLVELIIVIVIVAILAILAVVNYRRLVIDAMASEGKSLVSYIAKIEKIYYSEHACYLEMSDSEYNDNIGMDARGNSYFKKISVESAGSGREDGLDFIITAVSDSNSSLLVSVILRSYKDKTSKILIKVNDEYYE